jgi:CheY-like chemotaxis protein
MCSNLKAAIVDDCQAVTEVLSFFVKGMFGGVIDIDVFDGETVHDIELYDLVFLDEVMAGKSGSELVKELVDRFKYEKIPCVIFVTGFPADLMNRKLLEKGLDRRLLRYSILEKPFTVEKLYQTVKSSCPVLFDCGSKQLYRTPTKRKALTTAVKELMKV